MSGELRLSRMETENIQLIEESGCGIGRASISATKVGFITSHLNHILFLWRLLSFLSPGNQGCEARVLFDERADGFRLAHLFEVRGDGVDDRGG